MTFLDGLMGLDADELKSWRARSGDGLNFFGYWLQVAVFQAAADHPELDEMAARVAVADNIRKAAGKPEGYTMSIGVREFGVIKPDKIAEVADTIEHLAVIPVGNPGMDEDEAYAFVMDLTETCGPLIAASVVSDWTGKRPTFPPFAAMLAARNARLIASGFRKPEDFGADGLSRGDIRDADRRRAEREPAEARTGDDGGAGSPTPEERTEPAPETDDEDDDAFARG
jgi:hypothetical protein